MPQSFTALVAPVSDPFPADYSFDFGPGTTSGFNPFSWALVVIDDINTPNSIATTTRRDVISPITWTNIIVPIATDYKVPAFWGSAERRDTNSPIVVRLVSRQDISGALSQSAGILRDTNDQVSVAVAVRRDMNEPLSIGVNGAFADIEPPYETGARLTSAPAPLLKIFPLSFTTAIVIDAKSPMANAYMTQTDYSVPLRWNSSALVIFLDTSTPIAWGSSLRPDVQPRMTSYGVFISTDRVPVSAGAKVYTENSIPDENLSGGRLDLSVPSIRGAKVYTEPLSPAFFGIGVTIDKLSTTGWYSSISHDEPIPASWTGLTAAILTTMNIPLLVGHGMGVDSGAPMGYGTRLGPDHIVPLWWVGSAVPLNPDRMITSKPITRLAFGHIIRK